MKQCPDCRTTYTDDSLRFCLADGATLVEKTGEQETVVRSGMRVDIEQQAKPVVQQAGVEKKSGSMTMKIVIAVLLLGFLGLIIVVAAGAFFYINSANSNIASKSPTPTATPLPTTDLEKERLQQELANLQKKIDDDKKAETNKTPGFESDDLPTARVNSPNDGFLALRSAPDADKGERLLRIPHGTIVALENCEKKKVTIGGRTGRWCMVSYGGQTGWVFDAWLTY
jgi:hypothetical protein